MRAFGLTCSTVAACVLALAGSVPAFAAERVPMQVECEAMRVGWPGPRAFTVLYEGGGKLLKDIVVNEKARVFTPTDEASLYSTRGKKGWGVITEIPDQREGKWRGKQTDGGEEFKLRARDGKAQFLLAPDPADKSRRILSWSTEMEMPSGEELTAEGTGACKVVVAEEDAPPAPEGDKPEAPKADAAPAPEAEKPQAPEPDATPAPKKQHKEIRLFGSRKRDSADEGEK